MDRVIKFRAKATDYPNKGKWIYGSLFINTRRGLESKWVDTQSFKGWGPKIHPYTRVDYYTIADEAFECLEDLHLQSIDEKTIGQYIGRKDKDGIEIYEKDYIVSRIMWTVPGDRFVEYDDKKACFTFGGVEFSRDELRSCNITVTGNSIDNPGIGRS